jgi:hypothetical protein
MSLCPLELHGREGPADRRLGELLRILAFAIGLAALLLGRFLAPASPAPEPVVALDAVPWVALGLTDRAGFIRCIPQIFEDALDGA